MHVVKFRTVYFADATPPVYRRVYTAMGPGHDVERLSKEHGGAEGFQLVEKMRK